MASSCTVSSTLCEDQTLAESEEFKSRSRTTSSKSPWNCNVTKPTPITSFEEVMSEQLAVELHLSDELELAKSEHSLDHDLDCTAESSKSEEFLFDQPDTSNDALLAQMLQTQMDKEYNQYVTAQEEHVNKNSKISVSYSNYRTDEWFLSDDDNDEVDDYNPLTEHLDQSSNMLNIKNDKGYVVFGKKLVTKHDTEICGRRNTVRLENSFPTHFRTGDATGMDLQLNNKIFNSLKRHAYSEQKRGQRLHENKQHSTAEHAVDERTRLIMHRLIDRGIIATVNGIVSIGKEAVVLHADGGDIVTKDLEPILNETNKDIACDRIPKECAIKVFKTTLNEFKNRDKYIKDDYRFKDRFKKLNPRKVINMWAEKEMHNLVRIFKAGIPCPEVVLLKKHVLVMSFIGENHQAAPKLKNAILSSAQKILAYEQVVDMLKTMYHKCNLIHADFSEYNLLWHDETVWVIDVSQSVEPSHPRALEFLVRDCTNVSKFFKLLGVSNVLAPFDLFNEVSGLKIPADDPTAFLQTIKKMQSASEEHAHQGRNKASQIFEHSVVSNDTA